MDTQDLLNALSLGEDKDWEFKSAKGGLPKSMWESYSAMANTDGGAIVFGVRERDDHLDVHGVDDPSKMEKDFWSTIITQGMSVATCCPIPMFKFMMSVASP